MKLNQQKKLLLLILLFGALFRFYGLNWDQGYHLHPDERAIIMTVVKIQFPADLNSFLSPDSPFNPHFFAYGSFPFYLLKFIGEGLGAFNPFFTGYDLINIAGRFTSALFDLGTLALVFYLGRKLFGAKVGYIASFFYAVSVLPIQLSHFYAVDTLLTFFILAALYRLILFYEKPTIKHALFIGIFLGLALATKTSALVLFFPIAAALIAPFALLILRQPHKPRLWLSRLPASINHVFSFSFIISIAAFLVFAICSPYAIIDFPEFWRQTLEQSQMTRSAFTFPYTLQYVGKIPYLYEIKNIILWGLGPLLGIISFIGTIYFFRHAFSRKLHAIPPMRQGKWALEVIIAIFFLAYFLIVGRFAIGFMRYMLPLYPMLCIFGALAAYMFLKYLKHYLKNRLLRFTLYAIPFTLILIWPISFIRTYTVPNPRTTATLWINEFIPAGKVIAQEHWDDPVPIYGGQNYRIVTLPLYDPDTPAKWQNINQILAQTDFIIIASNRLYTPLQKLTDCKSLPQDKCYTLTAEYYQDLFNGSLGFQKIAEFTNYPTLPILKIPINDSEADESFTVYDHPKIMIFQKVQPTFNW